MTRLRDEAFRLRAQTYPRVFAIRAAYADVDSFQHINNVAIARFLEEGRAALNMEVFGVDAVVRPDGVLQLLFASIAIDYVSQGLYPGHIDVATGVSKIGASSFGLAGALFQNGQCVAVCETTTVHAFHGRPEKVPDAARAKLQSLLVQT
jgi:acyl-CoA thioester hydrolase